MISSRFPRKPVSQHYSDLFSVSQETCFPNTIDLFSVSRMYFSVSLFVFLVFSRNGFCCPVFEWSTSFEFLAVLALPSAMFCCKSISQRRSRDHVGLDRALVCCQRTSSAQAVPSNIARCCIMRRHQHFCSLRMGRGATRCGGMRPARGADDTSAATYRPVRPESEASACRAQHAGRNRPGRRALQISAIPRP